jgi:hypothetical protein
VRKKIILAAIAATALGSVAVMAAQQGGGGQQQPQQPMRFFVTSDDGTGNLGGLAGADARCQRLAAAAGAPADRTWHAYLSTQGAGAVNARDRIGAGPWHNAKGEIIANNVADLHGDVERDRNNIYKGSALDERGNPISGRGDQPGPNKHDILTGSDSLGRAFTVADNRTCNNWTYDGDDAMIRAQVGHHDRNGGNNSSWNSAHTAPGCNAMALARVGGAGKLYCFAIN